MLARTVRLRTAASATATATTSATATLTPADGTARPGGGVFTQGEVRIDHYADGVGPGGNVLVRHPWRVVIVVIVVIFIIVVARLGDGGEFLIIVLVTLFFIIVVVIFATRYRGGPSGASRRALFRTLARSATTPAASAGPTWSIPVARFRGGFIAIAIGVVRCFGAGVEIFCFVGVVRLAASGSFAAGFLAPFAATTAAATAATAARAIAFFGGRGFGLIGEFRIVVGAFDRFEVVVGRRRRSFLIVSFVAPTRPATA